MAWGKSKPSGPPSAIRCVLLAAIPSLSQRGQQTDNPPSQILPLVITLGFLAGLAWVGYQVYLSVGKIQAQAKEQMGKKDVVFTKDGLRVGVKHVENEAYIDRTQSWVVKAWNLSGEAKEEENKKKK